MLNKGCHSSPAAGLRQSLYKSLRDESNAALDCERVLVSASPILLPGFPVEWSGPACGMHARSPSVDNGLLAAVLLTI